MDAAVAIVGAGPVGLMLAGELRLAGVLDRVEAARAAVLSFRLPGPRSAHRFPATGIGINFGMLDAVNLAWKLAVVIAGWAPAGLLDTCQGALTRCSVYPGPSRTGLAYWSGG
jgi:2-polyprenyl-6-methoxyphenol hydroxylase-like FAD-dependent oxidoreductase